MKDGDMKAAWRTVLAILIAALTLVAVTASPAAAITGGQPDGNRHPNVGVIVFYESGGRFRCSATLISPTILITAAHCTADTVGSTLVSFESVIAPPWPRSTIWMRTHRQCSVVPCSPSSAMAPR
jgi:hypothetical protein